MTESTAETNEIDSAPVPMTPRLAQPTQYDDIWLSSLLRPLLITLLIGCINVACVGFLRHIMPDMPAAHAMLLMGMGVVGSLVGCYTTTVLINPDQRDRRRFAYRSAELGLLLFGVRVLTWAFIEGWPTWAEVIYQPLSALLTGVFVISILLVYFSWVTAAFATKQFLEMALSPDELMERPSDRYRLIYDSRMRSDRRSLLARFTEFWIIGGVLLLLFTAGSQFGPGSNGFFALSRQNIAPVVIGAGVVYFLVGFMLIALGRLAVLRAQWQIEEVATTDAIVRNWPFYSVGLVVIMGIIAILLPLGGTFWLAQILSFIVQAIYFVVYSIFGLLLVLLANLLPGTAEDTPAPNIPPMAPPVLEEAAQTAAVAPWLGGAVFWTVMILLLGYALYVYMSGKGLRFTWLQQIWNALLLRWRTFWAGYRQWRHTTLDGATSDESGDDSTPGWLRTLRRLRMGKLSPTDRVRFFYLSMLAQAQEQGIPRQPGETPLRYAPRLGIEIEEAKEDADRLTAEFVAIHYADHQVSEKEEPFFQELWQRLRKALNRSDGDK